MKFSTSVDDLVRPVIRDLAPYQAGQAPCGIILDANESPFPLPEALREEIFSSFRRLDINRYPDPAATRLKALIAEKDGVRSSQVAWGNGSDEMIQMILQVFCKRDGRVLYPVPTFSMYRLITLACGGIPVESPLDPQWDIDLPAFLDRMKGHHPSVIFLSTPNNPTGNCFSTDRVAGILEDFPGILVVDEAYVHYANQSLKDRLEDHPNLIILRSLSKIGMAGLRLGYCLASEKIIEYLNRVRLPYNINSLSQSATEVILKNWGTVREHIAWIREERTRVARSLHSLEGITPFPSCANFILFRVESKLGGPETFFQGLLDRGIRIRDLSRTPFLDRCFRVTIGTREENDAFLGALKG